MKKLLLSAIFLLVLSPSARAQEAEHQYRVEGYGFGVYESLESGPGWGGGFGGEAFVYKGLGLGGDLAIAAPFQERILSLNVSYSARSANGNRFEPFATGGFTHFSVGNLGPPPANGGNFGGGANFWLTKHVALRVEVRDTIGGRSLSIEYEPAGNSYAAPNNVLNLRIGVTFR